MMKEICLILVAVYLFLNIIFAVIISVDSEGEVMCKTKATKLSYFMPVRLIGCWLREPIGD